MSITGPDPIGDRLRQLAAENISIRQAAEMLGWKYDHIWRLAKRRGIVFRRSDGNEARAAAWAAKAAEGTADALWGEDDYKPVQLSDEAIAALYRGRGYKDVTFRRRTA